MNVSTQATQDTDDAPDLAAYNPRTVEHQLTLLHGLQAQGFQAFTHYDGVMVLVKLWDGTTAALYALPWSRGWSIFTSRDRAAPKNGYANVEPELRPFQRKLYAPAHTTGPWRVPADTIMHSLRDMYMTLFTTGDKQLREFDRKHWYWPRAAMHHHVSSANS